MRKALIAVVIVCGLLSIFNYFRPWIVPDTLVSGWGAVSAQPDKNTTIQYISFNATVKNNGYYPVYVKEVKAVFSDVLEPRFQSGDKSIPVAKWLKPGETVEVKGNWTFNVVGLKDKNAMEVGNYANFKVNLFY